MTCALFLLVPTAARGDVLADANALRAQHGLPALTVADEPLAAAVALRWAGDDTQDQAYSDPEGVFASAGGRALVRFALADDVHPAAFYPAEVLDPRARAIQAVPVPTNKYRPEPGTAYVLLADPAAAFTAPVLLGSARVNLDADTTAPRVLVPPSAKRTVAVHRRVAGGWVPAGHYGDQGSGKDLVEDGLGGGAVVTLAPDFIGEEAYAYASTYRVSTPGGAVTFTTDPAPPAQLARTFTFDRSVSPKLRRVFLANVRKGNAQARGLIARLDGQVTIKAHTGGESAAQVDPSVDGSAAYSISFNRQHLLDPKLSTHITWHELGHIADYIGVDAESFTHLFKRNGRKVCFPQRLGPHKGCVALWEVFADQFAFFATGNTRVRSGYNVSPLGSRRAFGRTLTRAFAHNAGRYGWYQDRPNGS